MNQKILWMMIINLITILDLIQMMMMMVEYIIPDDYGPPPDDDLDMPGIKLNSWHLGPNW
jgi:hypothetical protein